VSSSPKLYVTCDESLVIDTWSSTAPAALTITARVLTPQGRIDTLSWSHTPNSNRARATSYYPLAEGWLLSVIVDATDLAYQRGHCWCELSLMRGGGSNGVLEAVLLADYIAGTARLGWPGGFVRSSIEGPGLVEAAYGSTPAAGAEISKTVPANALWRLLALEFGLTTSVTAANRLPRLVIDDGTNDLQRLEVPAVQAASLTRTYSWAPGMPSRVAVASDNLMPLPLNTLLPSGYRFRTVTDSIQAADQYTAPRFLLEEWIQP
jgi:hypothetical protein